VENPARIVDDGNEWAREIIRSARADVPSEQFRRRLARRLGIASGAIGLSAVGSAKAVTTGVWLKWMVIGATAGVLTIGGAAVVVSPPEVKSGNSAVLTRASTSPNAARARGDLSTSPLVRDALDSSLASTAAPASTAPERAFELEPNGSGAENAKVGSNFPARKRTGSGSVAAPAVPAPSSELPEAPSASMEAPSTLVEELALIQSVRAALARSDANTALRSLDDYSSRYPQGRLKTEALVLRVATLAELGDRPSAKKLADQFLATHPDSPYARRLRLLSHSDTERDP